MLAKIALFCSKSDMKPSKHCVPGSVLECPLRENVSQAEYLMFSYFCMVLRSKSLAIAVQMFKPLGSSQFMWCPCTVYDIDVSLGKEHHKSL